MAEKDVVMVEEKTTAKRAAGAVKGAAAGAAVGALAGVAAAGISTALTGDGSIGAEVAEATSEAIKSGSEATAEAVKEVAETTAEASERIVEAPPSPLASSTAEAAVGGSPSVEGPDTNNFLEKAVDHGIKGAGAGALVGAGAGFNKWTDKIRFERGLRVENGPSEGPSLG